MSFKQDPDTDQKFLKYGVPAFIIIVILAIVMITVLLLNPELDEIIASSKDTTKYDTIDIVSHKVFMDIAIGN